LSQFFNDDYNAVHLNKEQQEFFDVWLSLTDKQKAVADIIQAALPHIK
jgi:hypothetical protein